MVKLYSNAICLPCLGAENRPLIAGYAKGGVFDESHNCIQEAMLVRRYHKKTDFKDGAWVQPDDDVITESVMIPPRPVDSVQRRLDGKYIFAGYLFPHYGHFILESLSRLWYIKQHPEVPIIWLGVHNQPDINEMEQEIFDLLGIRNPMILLTETTEVEELLVPEAGYIIHTRYTEAQINALRVVGPKPTVAGKKVWLSRSKLKRGRVLNEDLFENLLELQGWQIFHPQDHSVQDQINFLCDAEMIAGIEGSALHTLIFMPDFAGKIVIFARAKVINLDYIMIAEKLGLDQQLISVPRSNWAEGLKHWESNWVWTRFDKALEAVGVPRLNKPWSPLDRRLENIFKSVASFFKADSVIELWPETNSVVTLAPTARSASVCNRFDFDITPLKEQKTSYIEITSDQFFTTVKPGFGASLYCFRKQRDLGTLIRAFNSSLSFSTPSTIWIIEGRLDGETDVSANEMLLAIIQANYPLLTVIRVLNSHVAIVWFRCRHLDFGKMSIEGSPNTDYVADLPKANMNNIASEILSSREFYDNIANGKTG